MPSATARAERSALSWVHSAFAPFAGRSPERLVRAPGRVNLIGEHTDYDGGLVLPCAIDRDTVVAAASRDDARVRVLSRELGEAELALGRLARRGDWTDYVAAPFAALRERGVAAGGADLVVASDVPRESGLSSSAALGVAVTTALDRLQGLGLDARAVADVAWRGENAFVGVGCGIMDQYASALGERDAALRIDCRDRSVRTVPLDGRVVRLLVSASGVRRALAQGGYRERVDECARALAATRAAGLLDGDGARLRDLPPAALPELERRLDPLLFRRARHVVTENARVEAACRALEAGALADVGRLLGEGMASLRDDYAVSTPELDLLCALGDAQPGCFGSRLTGAGFGGCTLHLVRPEAAEQVARAIADGFAARFGRRPAVLEARAAPGASELPA